MFGSEVSEVISKFFPPSNVFRFFYFDTKQGVTLGQSVMRQNLSQSGQNLKLTVLDYFRLLLQVTMYFLLSLSFMKKSIAFLILLEEKSNTSNVVC